MPDWVEKLYQRMLAKNPAQRPQFMGDLVAQLERTTSPSWWQKLLLMSHSILGHVIRASADLV